MQTQSATIYFENIEDARRARNSLLARGASADPASQTGNGASLTVSNANEEAIAIIHAYGGRMHSTKDRCRSV